MSSMSYCRFQNTLRTLAFCRGVIEDMVTAPEECDPLSREELNAAKALAQEAMDLLTIIADHAGCDVSDLFDTDHASDALLNINQEVIDAEIEKEEAMAEEQDDAE